MALSANRRLLLTLWAVGVLALAGVISTAAPAAAYSTYLTRAPYLSDLTSSSVRVNFGTTTAIVKARARYGTVGSTGSCSAARVLTGSTRKVGYSVTYPTSAGSATTAGNQWKLQISGLGSGRYCYRVEGTTSTTSTTYTDLLGSATSSPTFSTAPATRFAVIGDWGQTGTGPDHLNADQANVISQLSRSGVGFAVSTGDIGYPSGSQSNYGDLTHSGPGVSGVFGPNYWPAAGKSIPMYPVPGNHGFTSTFTSLWPSTSIAAASNGRAANGTHTINGSRVTVPDYWFAYNVDGWRIYNLTAAWSDTVTTGSTAYAEDYKQHWAPGAPERTWLQNDLAHNAASPKIAILHYPLYSAVHSGDVQDTYLTAPPDGTQSVENVLATGKVRLVLNGHSHVYERNNPHNGLVSLISGGGGATLSPVDVSTTASTSKCAQKYPDNGQRVVAFAIGWSSAGGSACNTVKPASAAQVFHYLRITLSTASATVEALSSTGALIDETTIAS